jgi:hypothetical protein
MQSPSWEVDSRSAGQQIPSSFLETQGSLPCWQEPATRFFSQPVESSQHSHILFLSDSLQHYHSLYVSVFQIASSFQVFPPKCIHISFVLFVLHVHPSRPPWFYHPNNVWWTVQITHLLIIPTVFSSFLLRPPSYVQTSLADHTVKHHQSISFPWGERPSFTLI